jgi:hypothetical protein
MSSMLGKFMQFYTSAPHLLRASLTEPVKGPKPKNNRQFTGSGRKRAPISDRKRVKTENIFSVFVRFAPSGCICRGRKVEPKQN